MARTEKCVLTNLCMIYEEDRILVQDRRKPNWPGIAFPGGHIEPKESFVASVIREVKEETGLDISNVRLCGVQQFTQADGTYNRYIVFFFKSNTFSGELTASEEGDVFWIRRADICKYALADGFESMLEIFERDDLTENYWHFEGDTWIEENL